MLSCSSNGGNHKHGYIIKYDRAYIERNKLNKTRDIYMNYGRYKDEVFILTDFFSTPRPSAHHRLHFVQSCGADRRILGFIDRG